jgi:hypothetical protein
MQLECIICHFTVNKRRLIAKKPSANRKLNMSRFLYASGYPKAKPHLQDWKQGFYEPSIALPFD